MNLMILDHQRKFLFLLLLLLKPTGFGKPIKLSNQKFFFWPMNSKIFSLQKDYFHSKFQTQ